LPTTSETVVAAANSSAARRRDTEHARRQKDPKKRENRGFVQVYQLGWKRLQILMATNPNAARLYALLAEHLDGTGAVVATQEVLADMLGVSTKTVARHSKALEDAKALVRIPLSGATAYALNPEEVWRAYNDSKEHSAFHTRTLVKTRGGEADLIERRLSVLLRESQGEPELPLEDEIDPETGEVLNG
jgi:DNA-binding Lrp family transcriptional regulator